MIKIMQQSEIDFFLKQLERKKKALKLKEENYALFLEHEEQYNKIVVFLKQNLHRYLYSRIVRLQGNADKDSFELFLELHKDIFPQVMKAVNNGDVDKLEDMMTALHVQYMVVWRGKYELQKENRRNMV